MPSKDKNFAPVIFSCAGLTLTPAERDFFHLTHPLGFILFDRNCQTPDQVRRLTQDLRDCAARDDLLILIDQEGGEVARLKPPHWPRFPAARDYGALYQRDVEAAQEGVYIGARLMADELTKLGINVNCLPVLDVPVPEADPVIGSRAYSEHPEVVAGLGRSAAAGLRAGGVLPVIKHIPGHGRAREDSHLACPVVEASREALAADFLPFRALSDQPLAMTAHLVYEALDSVHPATLSRRIINDIVRGEIGFDGLLLSDDLSMGALAGSLADRAAGALAAGCDIVLHCSGDLDEMRAIAAALPEAHQKTFERLARARACLEADHMTSAALRARFKQWSKRAGYHDDEWS